MYQCKNLFNNSNIKQIAELGGIKVFECQKDLSVSPETAISAYYASEMNIRRHQLLITLNGDTYNIQAGAMQWTCGNVKMTSGIKGMGDFLGKAISSKVTKESTIKPEFVGN